MYDESLTDVCFLNGSQRLQLTENAVTHSCNPLMIKVSA